MKKIIPLLFVILSMSLFAQEPQYWEKIDFEFDSGIKIIDIYQNYEDYSDNRDNAFIVVSQNNNLYYFEDYQLSGTLVKGLDTNIEISKAKIIRTQDSTYIFIITNERKLLYTSNFGESWKIITKEIDNSEVIDLAYWNFYDYNMICIANTNGEAYLSSDYGITWNINTKGIEEKKITHLTSARNAIYCLTEGKGIYQIYSYIDNDWENTSEISEENLIKDFRIFYSSSYVYLDEEQKLKYEDHEVEIDDSITITCFTVSEWYFLVFGIQDDPLPFDYCIIFGTDKHGVYFSGNYHEETNQISNELYGMKITDIETNSISNPSLCLVGTDDGNLYYGLFPNDPGDVASTSINPLKLKITPHPIKNKARLNFTLPNNSHLSIKLYNTLGMELKTIADGYFNSGENAMPIDVSGLADGVYLIAIQYEGITVVEKLVVSK
ncbi:T9SS type A sorting domain-containing protein [Bacteroidota bacterium]